MTYHAYDFGDSPAEFTYNGLPMHRVRRIEYTAEYETIHSEGSYISSVLFASGEWHVFLEDGKTYKWPQDGVVFGFISDTAEHSGKKVNRIECRAQEGINPVVTETQITIEHNPAATVWSNKDSVYVNTAEAQLGRRDEVDKLPGINEVVKHPITNEQDDLEDVIISLNDDHKWTRYEIADWLESLDVDIRFVQNTKE